LTPGCSAPKKGAVAPLGEPLRLAEPAHDELEGILSIRGKAFIMGAYEHPERKITDRSSAQVHAELAAGALADAGLSFDDVDGYLCAGDAPGGFTAGGWGPLSMVEYLGLHCSYIDSTEMGGSAYIAHVGHAAAAIAAGHCNVALITMGGSSSSARRGGARPATGPEAEFMEVNKGMAAIQGYALAARRHMYEFGTTSAQLAEIKVAASLHAQHNPNAVLRDVVTVEEVLDSPIISSPLHRLDCCINTDGGGAVVVVSPEVAAGLPRHKVKVLGQGEAPKHSDNGRIDLTFSGAVWSGPRAFDEAEVSRSDIDYVGIYDSFTITVLETLEDLGFCEKGQGGRFVMDGALVAPFGKLPFNTDGGGLCSNHPSGRGSMIKIIEAVRQLRGEANPGTQVPDCQIALAHGTGGSLGIRMGSTTLILGQEDA
jgi:acetyl-CoA C-acetyltransferase